MSEEQITEVEGKDNGSGDITDVTISDRALSDDEVAEVYEDEKKEAPDDPSIETWYTEGGSINKEEANEAPEPVEGEDAAQVESEIPNDEEITERRSQLKDGLIQSAIIENEEAAVKIEKSNRDVTEKSNMPPSGPHRREGMSFGGSAMRRRRRGHSKQIKPKSQTYNSRRGIAKVYPDQPFKDVGEGTNTMDIPARRKT